MFVPSAPLKETHPEWLVGDHVKRTPYGRWSSVDYSHPEIRNLAFGFIDEVCHNYDVDGVELDFFRHLCYFKSTALGGTASNDERNMMTDIMRRVRSMTEDVGMKRGRPILMAIRVPDSTGFCRDLGLVVEFEGDPVIDKTLTVENRHVRTRGNRILAEGSRRSHRKLRRQITERAATYCRAHPRPHSPRLSRLRPAQVAAHPGCDSHAPTRGLH